MDDKADPAGSNGAMGLADIKARIPHRYPFLLIDRVLSLAPMTAVTAIKNVSANEPFFEGHFPNRPVMPGVLIVEAMAQAGAILVSTSLELDVERQTVFFASIDRAKFRRAVEPGDQLRLEVAIVAAKSGLYKFEGVGFVGEAKAAEAAFAAKLVEYAR
ncbi:MAG: 3-hydroxyacyl-ACP dehydratase FabZ [Maricaulaceae bacterium]